MIKKICMAVLMLGVVWFSGCGEDEGSRTKTAGSHFQGRDCMACHNSDLQSGKRLLAAGTLFKRHDVQNSDDLNEVCGGTLFVRFVDVATGSVYDAKDYNLTHQNSDGSMGKGNLFVLTKELPALAGGNYALQIWNENGYLLAASKDAHPITGEGYTIAGSDDSNNRVSCNACHNISGSALPLYVQQNLDRCQ